MGATVLKTTSALRSSSRPGRWRWSALSVLPVLAIASAALLPAIALGETPRAGMLVGTAACPKLNAHERRACTFSRKGHDFQVWPERILIQATTDPKIWLVTSSGHDDGMFDHVLKYRKDDHVTFQCFVRADGKYYGPTGFQIRRGGVWATYGEGIVTVAAVGAGAIGAYFSGGAAGPAAGAAGGKAAAVLGDFLGKKYGSRSWELEASKVAADTCAALAR